MALKGICMCAVRSEVSSSFVLSDSIVIVTAIVDSAEHDTPLIAWLQHIITRIPVHISRTCIAYPALSTYYRKQYTGPGQSSSPWRTGTYPTPPTNSTSSSLAVAYLA